MAFITNTKTGVTIECGNKDVIATLKTDPDYIITDVPEVMDILEAPVDLADFKLAELKEEAIKRGVDIPKKVTKSQLIALLS